MSLSWLENESRTNARKSSQSIENQSQPKTNKQNIGSWINSIIPQISCSYLYHEKRRFGGFRVWRIIHVSLWCPYWNKFLIGRYHQPAKKNLFSRLIGAIEIHLSLGGLSRRQLLQVTFISIVNLQKSKTENNKFGIRNRTQKDPIYQTTEACYLGMHKSWQSEHEIKLNAFSNSTSL